MKFTFKSFIPLIFVAIFLPVLTFAQTPSLPHQFFGAAKYSNEVAVSNGMKVEAKINGIVAGDSITANGNYGYNPNLLFITDNQGTNAGKTVEFYIDGVKANEAAIFANGNSSQLNLTIPTPAPVAEASSGSGGSSSYSPPTQQSSLTPAQQKVDANKDNRIDIFDFNTLMVNWGSTSAGNVADFDGSGKVDIFDFNLLMVHWAA